jgi:hypothetical protein
MQQYSEEHYEQVEEDNGKSNALVESVFLINRVSTGPWASISSW